MVSDCSFTMEIELPDDLKQEPRTCGLDDLDDVSTTVHGPEMGNGLRVGGAYSCDPCAPTP